MKKMDLLWILAYPIYQIVGTLRHEGGHALAILAQGGTVDEFVFWPTEGGYWGYVSWQGASTSPAGEIAIDAAPYLVDALTFLPFFAICMLVVFKWRWLWINLIAIGIVSPLVNSAYNYRAGLRTGQHDVGNLMAAIPPTIVHAYFWMTLTAYLIGLILVFTVSRMARKTESQPDL
jgi:hypothetical protein